MACPCGRPDAWGRLGGPRLEAACRLALDVGDPSYRTIKGILAAGTETTTAPAQTGDAGAPGHLHGPDALFGTPGQQAAS